MNNYSQDYANPEGTRGPRQNVDHINSYIESMVRNDKVALRRRIVRRISLSTALAAVLTIAPSYELSNRNQTDSAINTSDLPSADTIVTDKPTTNESLRPTPTETAIATQEVQAFPDARFESYASWYQDFSKMPDGPLDSKTWNIMDGPAPANQEKEYYKNSTDNVRIENGKLVLEAQKQPTDGLNYTSGRIDTLGKEDFQYGKLEITAILPVGVGTWPAIWMAPSGQKYSGNPTPKGSNPFYLNGEIDMAETSGIEPHVIYCIGHSLLDPTNSLYPTKYFSTMNVPDSDVAFHVYGVSWTPDKIAFTIDGNTCYSVSKNPNDDYQHWPYDQPYNLILNLAIGGKWYSGDPKQYPPDGIDQSMFPVQMSVDAIRYFPLIGQ